MPTCGSLFSGAGLLDAGLSLAGWEHAWLCESVPERRDLLRARFPAARVFDDVRTLRGPFAADADRDPVRQQPVAVGGRSGEAVAGWAGEAPTDAGSRGRAGERRRRSLEPDERAAGADDQGRATRVVLLAGGFPCRGISSAGKREGFGHAETVLWHEMRRVISEVRPRYVVIENVAAILGMAASPDEPAGSLWGTVLGDLAALGFGDIRWDVLPAAAVGAPHLRERTFCVAAVTAGAGAERDGGQWRFADGRPDVAGGGRGAAAGPCDCGHRLLEHRAVRLGGERWRRVCNECSCADFQPAADANRARTDAHPAPGRSRPATGERGLGAAADAARDAEGRAGATTGADGERTRPGANGVAVEWGDYGPAIRRWEAIHGAAPEPLVRRLDARRTDMSTVQKGLERSRMRAQRARLSALGDSVHVHVAQLVGAAVLRHYEHGSWE